MGTSLSESRLSEQIIAPAQFHTLGSFPTLARRLASGLVEANPHPDLLVTRTEPAPAEEVPLAPVVPLVPPANRKLDDDARAVADLTAVVEHPGVADLAASLESLHLISQSVLSGLIAITQAPRDLQTVVALSTHRMESLAHEFELQVERGIAVLGEQVGSAVAAAQQVRSALLEAASVDRPDLTAQTRALSERLAELETGSRESVRSTPTNASTPCQVRNGSSVTYGSSVTRGDSVTSGADTTGEAADLVLQAAQQAVADIASQVAQARAEHRRGERVLERMAEHLLERMDQLAVQVDAGQNEDSKRRFRRS